MRVRSRDKDAVLLTLGAANHGVITTTRARAGGISKSDLRTRVKGGFLATAGYGCYLLEERRDDLTPFALVQARHPTAALAGRSAAYRYRFDGFDDPNPPDHLIASRPWSPAVNLVVASFQHRDVTWLEGLRLLRPVPAIGSLGHWTGVDEVEWALECALRRKLATESQFHDWLDRGPEDAGRAALRTVLARREPGTPTTESFLETLAIQRVFRPQGFAVERQVVVRDESGGFIGRVDFELDGVLLVEANGMAFHSTPAAVQRDSWRALSLRLSGREVEHITWRDVNDRPGVTGRRLRARCQQLRDARGGANMCSPKLGA